MEKIAEYFKRIGLEYDRKLKPDEELLRKLQYAHCTSVPYENLDIIRGIPLSLDIESLYEKIVLKRRGGFCFELNGLFGWLLGELGYEVKEHAARYLRGETKLPMRRHRVLEVKAGKESFICDVGIGEVSPRYPLKFEYGAESDQFGEKYRIDRDECLGYVIRDFYNGKWRDFYSFTDEIEYPEDFTALSFYCEKHPDSPFTKFEMLSLKTKDGRITLNGNLFKEFKNGEVFTKEIKEEEKEEIYKKFGLSKI